MNSLNELDKVLAGIYRPFDAKAWERFSEWNPEASAWLATAVTSGLSVETIVEYGKRHGYSDAAANWIRHAATYLHSLEMPERIIPGRGEAVRIIDTESAAITKRFTAARRAE